MVSSMDKAEYLVALVKEYGKSEGMTDVLACRKLQQTGCLQLVEEHYDIAHTLSFDSVIALLEEHMK